MSLCRSPSWRLRPIADVDGPESSAVVALWLADHEAGGVRARRLGRRSPGATSADSVALARYVRWLVARAVVTVATDLDEPILFGFAAWEPDLSALHYAAVVPTLLGDPDLAAELLRVLLAPLEAETVGITMEIPALNRPELKALGVRRARWYHDSTWQARNLPWTT